MPYNNVHPVVIVAVAPFSIDLKRRYATFSIMDANQFLRILLEPLNKSPWRKGKLGILLLLCASASCVVLASWIMPAPYSWLSHFISESAAQGLRGAWIARLGFLFFGWAVIWLALCLRSEWARIVYWMNLAFGIFMVGTAAFSHKPWIDGVAFDRFEDFLHSVTATGMGFAFTIAVVARFFQRPKGQALHKTFDLVAIIAASLLPPMAGLVPSVAGLLQRLMFLVAYLWFAWEAMALNLPGPETDEKGSPLAPAAEECL